MAERDDKYVQAIIDHLSDGVPVLVQNPRDTVIPLLQELLELRAAARRRKR